MNGTPKMQRKASLSLSTRLNKKRHSASPQNHLKTPTENNRINSCEVNSKTESLQKSPSVISICYDGGIECTPPNKKMPTNLDESLDYSPKMLDSSFSPSCLLSQTLGIDSPEVGWKWSRHSGRSAEASCGIDAGSIRTPDSAYAADSSFASAGSSSTEFAGNTHIRGSSHQHCVNGARREDQRKIMEKELRRVEHSRADELLKQRCAKLQEQLKSAGTQKLKTDNLPKDGILKNNKDTIFESSKSVEMKSQSTTQSAGAMVKFQRPEKSEEAELLNDFFDDSDIDCFLLKATQEIESKIVAKTPAALTDCTSTIQKSSINSECSSTPYASSAPAAASSPPSKRSIAPLKNVASSSSGNKDKRSSFYMKFLEDDCPDEWFVSLDEVILQATENKKPRNSLQRYNSMPVETAGTTNILLNKKDTNDNFVMSRKQFTEETKASSSSFSKMKRHSSTHTLSPANSHYRSRRQL